MLLCCIMYLIMTFPSLRRAKDTWLGARIAIYHRSGNENANTNTIHKKRNYLYSHDLHPLSHLTPPPIPTHTATHSQITTYYWGVFKYKAKNALYMLEFTKSMSLHIFIYGTLIAFQHPRACCFMFLLVMFYYVFIHS